MGKYIAGHERVASKMAKASSRGVAVVADALEAGGVLVRNHARANHPHLITGEYPTASEQAAITAFHETTGRFTTRTGALAGNIIVGPAKIGTNGMVVEVTAATKYAEKVEAQYPFMIPALMASTDKIKAMISAATKGL